MEFKVLTTNKGFRYMKDAKFCKKSDIPEDILAKLLVDKVVNTLDLCPFCKEPGTEEKTLNSTRYLLCLEHYQNKTTGELAELFTKQAQKV
jgi:hypothetical protein